MLLEKWLENTDSRMGTQKYIFFQILTESLNNFVPSCFIENGVREKE